MIFKKSQQRLFLQLRLRPFYFIVLWFRAYYGFCHFQIKKFFLSLCVTVPIVYIHDFHVLQVYKVDKEQASQDRARAVYCKLQGSVVDEVNLIYGLCFRLGLFLKFGSIFGDTGLSPFVVKTLSCQWVCLHTISILVMIGVFRVSCLCACKQSYPGFEKPGRAMIAQTETMILWPVNTFSRFLNILCWNRT